MESPLRTTFALAGAWIAFGSLAAAQSATSLAAQPPPRIPRSPLAVPNMPVVAEPSVTTDSMAFRAPDASPQAERAEREASRVVSLPMSDARWSRVHWNTVEDGTIWVRGRNFKASFGADGATYYPLFGSDQPRHFPLALSLASATSGGQEIQLAPARGAVRDGERVIIDRGAIDEVYEIGVDSMEQTFVVEERPSGDLNLFVGLETELGRNEVGGGFEFSNELGGIRYSDAFVRAADGARLPLATHAFGGGIRIEVTAQVVAASQFPLVVDPVVSTFDVDATTYDNYTPDVAHDATTGRWLYVYRESGPSEYDVYTELISASGTVLQGAYANLSTESWNSCSVANLNAYDQFMVVGTVPPPDGPKLVACQTSAHDLSYGPQFTIDAGPSFRSQASVGGDPYETAPAYYCVAWGQGTGLWTSDVRARLVTNTGSLVGGGPMTVGSASQEEWYPHVSKGNGGTRWNVVWNAGIMAAPWTWDVYGAQIEWDGSSIPTPAFPIAVTPSTSEVLPSVSSPLSTGEYVVVYGHDFGTDHDIVAARILGGSIVSADSITILEQAGTLYDDQREPSVDADGDRFVVSYSEGSATSLYRVHLASFALLASELRVLESHVPLSPVAVTGGWSEVVSAGSTGGAPRRFALAWDENALVSGDIGGAFFDALTVSTYCYGDGSGATCPCANNGAAGRGCANSVNPSGALLTAVGVSDVSADNVQLRANGMPNATTCLFFQGTTNGPNAGHGAPFGDGLRCTGGSVVRLATKTTVLGVGLYPQAGDASLSVQGNIPASGGVRYYQAWYRNSATFCTASTFNLTNGARIVWLP